MISRGKFRQERGSTSELVIRLTRTHPAKLITFILTPCSWVWSTVCHEAEQCIKYQCENTDESDWRLNTGMAPTCDWMIKIVKVNNLHLNMLITRVILMMIDVVIHGQGRVTWRITGFLLIKLFGQFFCISTYLDWNVATITVRMVLISRSERWILCLFSL